MEVLPGKYSGKCWNDGSIYFTEEAFACIEPSIEQEYPEYDPYAFNDIPRDIWWRIIERLEKVIALLDEKPQMDLLKEHIRFFFADSEQDFRQNDEQNLEMLRDMLTEFVAWTKEQLKHHDYISVLGI